MENNDYQDFWFPTIPGQTDKAFLIKIPLQCKVCEGDLKIRPGGNQNGCSFIDNPCNHVWDWNDLLKQRIDKIGANCKICNIFNDYVNEPYTCYSCKTGLKLI